MNFGKTLAKLVPEPMNYFTAHSHLMHDYLLIKDVYTHKNVSLQGYYAIKYKKLVKTSFLYVLLSYFL